MEHINFLEQKRFELTYLVIVIGFIVYIFLLGTFVVFQKVRLGSLEKDLTEIETSIASHLSSAQIAAAVDTPHDEAALSKVMNVVENKITWSSYLAIISNVPDRVWLMEIKLSKDKILITGNYTITQDVVGFLEKLKESKLFKNVVLRSTQLDTHKDKQETLTFVIEGTVM